MCISILENSLIRVKQHEVLKRRVLLMSGVALLLLVLPAMYCLKMPLETTDYILMHFGMRWGSVGGGMHFMILYIMSISG